MAFVLKKTIGETMLERARQTPGIVGFRHRSSNEFLSPIGTWREVTFLAFRQECEQTSLGLKRAGVGAGDRVAILSKTLYEWTLADLAILGRGAITVTIYPSLTAEEIFELLEHSQAKAVFAETEADLERILPYLPKLPNLERIVVFETTRVSLPLNAVSLFDIQRDGELERHVSPNLFEETLRGLKEQDLFTLCYTSGTTGRPKGAMLTHENLMSVLGDCLAVYGGHIRPNKEVLVTFLPFSHIIGRLESMSTFVFGWQLNFVDSIEKMPELLREIRPTILFSVPRIFEKALSEVETRVKRSSLVTRNLYGLALRAGQSYFSKRRRGKSAGPVRRTAYRLFRETVLRRVVEGFGGRLRFAICGGAPLSKTLGETFEVLGILILEGYGLTETCAPVAINSVTHHKFGTVGKPLPDVSVRIAEDGEILLRSKKIFSGYWRDEAATQDAFDADGWFKTGDIGFVDPRGYLHVTDRKKDLIITSGGKNVAPQKIENFAKTFSPLLAEFIVVGDRQKHLAALITLDRTALARFAKQEHLLYSELAELARHQKVQAEVERIVAALNQHLARFETIKRFAILTDEFSVESGELTPSLKVKRAVVRRKYKALIDALYQIDTPFLTQARLDP